MNSKALINFFQHLRLPLQRGENNIITFLDGHFSKFEIELDKLLESQNEETDKQVYDELKGKKDVIKNFYQTILGCLDFYRDGKVLDAHLSFESKMTELQDSLISVDIRGRLIFNRFYRIRPDVGKNRRDLFHIRFDEITKVKAYRYSISGFPCLYLTGSPDSTALSLSWFECGLPDKFYWSEFKLDEMAPPIELVDFTQSPFFGAINPNKLVTSLLNKSSVDEFLTKMVLTYPLMSACSLVVRDKRQNFVPEYIIPQMLLGWIRKNGKYRGVAYHTCSAIKSAHTLRAFNIVIPPVKAETSGHCKTLQAEFKLSKPRLIDVVEIFKSLKGNYDKVRNYRDWLNQVYRYDFALGTMREILSLCNSFIDLFEQYTDRKIQDSTWIYQYIETTNLIALRMSNSKYLELMIEESKREDFNVPHKIAICNEIWERFKAIQNCFFDFWNFNHKEFDTTVTDDEFCYIENR